ncbi:pyrroline-5-carboxylate reductase [Roseibacillus ishigakijimensis]|uniref:Pyrroline-5-carboxylate reductase n=1 Tax=Roseibacillus ishigakijimensis TaxID=454146 RepID=A0A934RSH4_9BACT|nr:pyrroline-5-carboxylate reductase [Roseibacillus ishigakijimensis]MBK1835107.1 pyrroline-5-carboxylate reductase [Roseibacillus ishigakijimensis]
MKLGLIGSGRMGRALVIGAMEAKAVNAEDVVAYDIESAAVDKLVQDHGVSGASTLREVVTTCDTILLCTKPADVPEVLREIATFGTDPNRILLISVAAGVTISSIENFIFSHARVIRAMPNTPALVGKGAAAFSPGSNATQADIDFVTKLFGSVGKVVEVPEKLMDAVTGLSGSGPGFAYLMIEALADGAVASGLPRDKALELASQSLLGAAAMVQESGLHPGMLKDMVTSPGGTTITGITVLEKNGFRSAVIEAVRAATNRSIELGRSQD